MSHQEQGSVNDYREQHQELNLALSWLLQRADFSAVTWREDCGWSIRGLVMCAILWAWSGETALVSRFQQAKKITRRMLGDKEVRDTSYQAFMKLLLRWMSPLVNGLKMAFRRRMQIVFSKRWKVAGFVAFGIDGSRLELPRTEANEDYFSPQKSGSRGRSRRTTSGRRQRKHEQSAKARERKAENPQMWVTMAWHLGVGLPWSWRLGPSNSSEREHLREMLPELPANSLLVADAGFVGYSFWRDLQAAGHHLLIRVGSNVKLLSQLGYAQEKDGVVYCWPDSAAAKSQPPLTLRLVVVRNGSCPVYLVTSVLDHKLLSDADVAATYARRWGIELFYRQFKQTFDRTKLRSHTPENALLEAQWSLLGLWAMTIHAQYQLQLHRLDTARLSIAKALRAYRGLMYEYKCSLDSGEDLRSRLKHALSDKYQRKSKASRNYPRKKCDKPPRAPVITLATKAQVELAHKIKRVLQTRLTA